MSVEAVTDFLEAVDQLEELVGSGRRIPFSGNVVLNEEQVMELIDRARLSAPDELVEARHTVSERDRLLDGARREAERLRASAVEEREELLAEARAEAARLVDEHAVLRTAQERADDLVGAAEARAARITTEADDYARDVMRELADQLERQLTTVQRGLDTLPPRPAVGGRRRRAK